MTEMGIFWEALRKSEMRKGADLRADGSAEIRSCNEVVGVDVSGIVSDVVMVVICMSLGFCV